jgi:5,10-methylene-tetrahydrofolate dehydrogenase/methenyl tetrahydrofolate cyclohydrolase
MIRWGSSVNGSADLQHFYLIACNERLNKHFFGINRHPKLQWLCATTVSPDMGVMRHNWIAPKKKEAGASGIKKQLMELYPNMKSDEIELMAKINTKKDIDAYLKQAGEDVKK